jgi:probable F420-dependent oxidoreductase
MPHPFRFGVQISKLPAASWQADARRIEELGYDTLFLPDHFGTQWDPTTALAGIAAVTQKLKVGSLVYDVDYRHPVVFAKAAATLQVLSDGRHEFGIGAGWMETDYVEAGLPYDRPGIRISRLEEALEIITSMWQNERTTFSGNYYSTNEIAQATELGDLDPPPILIGGGGPRLLELAGRYADIVGINPKLVEGKVTAETPADSSPERVREKIGWVREGAEKAGRNPNEIEFNSLSFVTSISEDVAGLRSALAKSSGMSVEQVAECPLFLTGSAQEIGERLERQREESGISYIVIQGGDVAILEQFASEIADPLRRLD